LRQANCYYSSSDAAFADRYQADAEYGRALRGEIPLEGGWRVYSSGAGIASGLILGTLFGLRLEKSWLVVDPVIPKALDGLRIEIQLAGHRIEVDFSLGDRGCGPVAVQLNGADLPFRRGPNPYRTGAAEVPMAAVADKLRDGENRLTVRVG
jgi:cellobiose phosphorylase